MTRTCSEKASSLLPDSYGKPTGGLRNGLASKGSACSTFILSQSKHFDVHVSDGRAGQHIRSHFLLHFGHTLNEYFYLKALLLFITYNFSFK